MPQIRVQASGAGGFGSPACNPLDKAAPRINQNEQHSLPFTILDGVVILLMDVVGSQLLGICLLQPTPNRFNPLLYQRLAVGTAAEQQVWRAGHASPASFPTLTHFTRNIGLYCGRARHGTPSVYTAC